MAGVYSVAFDLTLIEPAENYTYGFWCPEGYTGVLRDLVVVPDDSSETLAWVASVLEVDGVTSRPLWSTGAPYIRAGVTYHWTGRQVFEYGERLTFFTNSENCGFAASGYLLVNS